MSSARITRSTTRQHGRWRRRRTDVRLEVDPGDQVTYTLRVTNTTSNAVVDSAVVTDDLTDVLQYASLDEASDRPDRSGHPHRVTTLTWNVPDPAARTRPPALAYTVTVDDDAFNADPRQRRHPR